MKNKINIAQGLKSLFVGNFLSKILGLVREILLSAWFGTGETAAALRIAQTAYLLPVQALIGDSLSAGLLPLYKKLEGDNNGKHQVLIFCAVLYATLLSLMIMGGLFLFSYSISSFIAPNSSVSLLLLASNFIKILAIATPFYIISSTLVFIETAYGYFSGVSYRPALLNVFSILGACFAVYFNFDNFLVIFILLSHVIFFILTIFKLHKIGNVIPSGLPSLFLVKEVFSSFFINMLPLLGLPLIAQINVLFERIISSKIGDNVIPAVDYARFLCDTTVQLIAIPLGIITMAKFGGRISSEFENYIRNSFLVLIFVSIPIGIFSYQYATDIITIFFGRGKFDAESIKITSTAFQWMGLALCFTVVSYFLVKTLNSQLKNKLALWFTLFAVLVNISINIIFWDILGAAVVGLGVLGYSITLFIFTVYHLQLFKVLFSFFYILIILILGQIFINEFLKSFIDINIYLNMLIFFVANLIYFLFLINFFPKSKEIFSPIISSLLRKEN